MKYFVKTQKDTSIYSDYPEQNAGIDEILNLNKVVVGTTNKVSRILIKYDLTEVSKSIASGYITNPKFTLDIKQAELRELAYEFQLNCHPLLSDWENGLGKRGDNPKQTDGVSWNWKDKLNGSSWVVTGSDYNSNISSSVVFNKNMEDLSFDVTDMVNSHISGVYPNHGFVIKHTDEQETNDITYGYMSLFSSETNTIYEPKLSVEWDDSLLVTGSLVEVTDEDVFIAITNIKYDYKVNNTYKFRISCRNLYNQPSFSTTSPLSVVNRLPDNSYYSIIDNVSKDVIVPFSEYSRISCDNLGSYFNISFDGWEAERYYKILFKIDNNDGTSQYIDKNLTFNLNE